MQNRYRMARFGFDLDNTIICYDRAFPLAAQERGLIDPAFSGGKRELKDYLQAQGPSGERSWQELQGYVYGAGIHLASIFPGAHEFLVRARAEGHELVIVSHKTQTGHFDPQQIDLRAAAIEFLIAHDITTLIPAERIFFCATRLQKLQMINDLHCEIFVDDLEDILGDPSFPATTRALHFTMDGGAPGRETFTDWAALGATVYGSSTLA